jgi:hypothetical protein
VSNATHLIRVDIGAGEGARDRAAGVLIEQAVAQLSESARAEFERVLRDCDSGGGMPVAFVVVARVPDDKSATRFLAAMQAAARLVVRALEAHHEAGGGA